MKQTEKAPELVQLVAPNGSEIVGTVEQLFARANVSGFYRDDAGGLVPEFSGDTKLYWDTQESVTMEGEALMQSADGKEWKISECRPA